MFDGMHELEDKATAEAAQKRDLETLAEPAKAWRPMAPDRLDADDPRVASASPEPAQAYGTVDVAQLLASVGCWHVSNTEIRIASDGSWSINGRGHDWPDKPGVVGDGSFDSNAVRIFMPGATDFEPETPRERLEHALAAPYPSNALDRAEWAEAGINSLPMPEPPTQEFRDYVWKAIRADRQGRAAKRSHEAAQELRDGADDWEARCLQACEERDRALEALEGLREACKATGPMQASRRDDGSRPHDGYSIARARYYDRIQAALLAHAPKQEANRFEVTDEEWAEAGRRAQEPSELDALRWQVERHERALNLLITPLYGAYFTAQVAAAARRALDSKETP